MEHKPADKIGDGLACAVPHLTSAPVEFPVLIHRKVHGNVQGDLERPQCRSLTELASLDPAADNI
jgi:hypothetical protein